MRKCANISPYMKRPLVIYDYATAPFWISWYMWKIWFSFLSVFLVRWVTNLGTNKAAFLHDRYIETHRNIHKFVLYTQSSKLILWHLLSVLYITYLMMPRWIGEVLKGGNWSIPLIALLSYTQKHSSTHAENKERSKGGTGYVVFMLPK